MDRMPAGAHVPPGALIVPVDREVFQYYLYKVKKLRGLVAGPWGP